MFSFSNASAGRRPRAAFLVAGVASALLATACSTSTSAGTGTSTGASTGAGTSASQNLPTAPIPGRPAPAKVATKPVKIAMIGFSNNPYWVSVQQGVESANSVLKKYNAQVSWIVAGSNIDVPTVNSAALAAATAGANGIGFFIAGQGNCPVIKQLSSKGIAVGTYNTLFDCVGTSGGVIDYAQQQYQAGVQSAKALIKAVGDRTGKVGIITSLFSAPGAEQRRQGFLAGLANSNITPVNKGVEANDSASTTFTDAQNFLTSTPDLVGIYCTAGGPFGAAEAVHAAHKDGQVKVIGYDVIPENVSDIQNGSMYGVTGQDAFGQGYNVAIDLFNAYVTGKKPGNAEVNAFSPFVTKANLSQYNPATHTLGSLGAS